MLSVINACVVLLTVTNYPFILSVIMLCVIMLSVVMLSVVMLCVVVLNVMAPLIK